MTDWAQLAAQWANAVESGVEPDLSVNGPVVASALPKSAPEAKPLPADLGYVPPPAEISPKASEPLFPAAHADPSVYHAASAYGYTSHAQNDKPPGEEPDDEPPGCTDQAANAGDEAPPGSTEDGAARATSEHPPAPNSAAAPAYPPGQYPPYYPPGSQPPPGYPPYYPPPYPGAAPPPG